MSSYNWRTFIKSTVRALAVLLIISLAAGGAGFTQASATGAGMPLTGTYFTGGYASGGEVPIMSAYASSTLQETGYNHSPMNICDKDTASDWSEGAYGRGVGEWIELSFGAKVPVDAVVIYPGFWKTEKLFNENCRPASMELLFSDGSTVPVAFPDEMSPTTVLLSRTVNTQWIRFTVNSVFSGSKYQDLCISEIQVFSNDKAYTEGAEPNLYIVGNVMPQSVAYGSAVDLGGIVRTGSGILTEVTCSIIDVNGYAVSSSTAWPMSFEHNINRSVINDELRFGKLAKGNYTLKISAVAVNGSKSTAGVVAQYPFTVGAASSSASSSSSSAEKLAPPTDYVYYGDQPFYGIWCEASKYYPGMVKLAQQWEALGYSPKIVITTDWSGLNKESWYAITPGVYYSQADAESMFPIIQSIYPTAFIKYTNVHN